MRIAMAGLATLMAAASAPAASAKELKPKFGDIGGVYYTDVSENREACRQAIRNKIALCRQNTNFESNTKNREYAGCLRIFRQQAQSCVTHFRHQMSKCDLSGAARITDFTGFSCEVTKTVVEEGGGPGISPMDRRMRARTGSNLRAGPGTNHRVVGSLRTGQEVQVTGRAGDWLRIAAPGGGAAFVHGSLLVAMAERRQEPQRGSPAAHLSPKCAGIGKGAKCWLELANKLGCYIFDPYYDPPETATWSGPCAGGVAVGRGTWGWKTSGDSGEATGTLVRGKRHGRWIIRSANGAVHEGSYVDGKKHGRWVDRYPNGAVLEGSYLGGKRHGNWVARFANGTGLETEYRNGSIDGQPGIYTTKSGKRIPGRWSGNCFRDGKGKWLVWSGKKENCPNK